MEEDAAQEYNANGTQALSSMGQHKKPSRSTKACLECRSMKSRCNGDGVNPCERCIKRGASCIYEQTVRRRGKDKKQRIVKKRQKSDSYDSEPLTKRARPSLSTSSSSVDAVDNDSFLFPGNMQVTLSPKQLSDGLSVPPQPPHPPHHKHSDSFDLSQALDIVNAPATSFLSPQTQFSQFQDSTPSASSPLLVTPNMDYQRDTFWDVLINDRCSSHVVGDRAKAIKLISNDLWLVFSRCDFITTLFNMTRFFDNISCTTKRMHCEPSLIQSLLAISHAIQGQFHLAYLMADRAHSSLRTAMMTGRLTIGVAQSAVVLQYYESFPLGTFHVKRVAAPLYAADAVIKNLALTCLDADRVSHVFDDDGIPISTTTDPSSQELYIAPPQKDDHATCPCESWSTPAHLTRKEEAVRFRHIPKFSLDDTQVSDSHIQQEEIRRVVWGTVNNGWYLQMLDPHAVATLHTSQSSNYGVFYTAESFVLSLPEDGMKCWSRYTLWAFLDRLKLLCHAATRLSRSLPPLELHMRASKISGEVEKIEKDLTTLHSCNKGVHGWHVSNVAFITRLILTAKTRQFSGVQGASSAPSAYYTRQRAREWLDAHSLIWDNIINKQSIKKQPMIFVALVCQALRCLDLLALDSAFTRAIYVARNILKGIEEMISAYPAKESADLNRIIAKVHVSCDELENRTSVAPFNTADNDAAELLLENIKHIKSEHTL
ncbi:hypothetical protein E3P99_01096 [Wallemia hederae]|uniref:Zn(2)-C6 fungal-type domain-containing protein n=1 Tax=Wallemia hederae TaxID=1540922 RepID=A0A4T0FWR7_9BASI|nr:hypothetical protein E3P99_01096 [Wallemia hederae]